MRNKRFIRALAVLMGFILISFNTNATDTLGTGADNVANEGLSEPETSGEHTEGGEEGSANDEPSGNDETTPDNPDETNTDENPKGDSIGDEEALNAVSYDYVGEVIKMATGYEVAVDNTVTTGLDELVITDILDRTTDRLVYVRRKASEDALASEWHVVALPERPEAPVLITENASSSTALDGRIIGTTVGMEYKLSSNFQYVKATDNYTVVKAGAYQVRMAATTSNFAGKVTTVTVKEGFVELNSSRRPVIENTTAYRAQPYVGDVLRATTSAGPGIIYQWYANNVEIKDASEQTLKLTSSTYGKNITVKATQIANADGEGHPYENITITSAVVGPVKKIPIDNISEGDFRDYLTINYSTETATINSDFEMSTSDSSTSGSTSLKLSTIIERSSDRHFYVRRKATESYAASNWCAYGVKGRPSAPSGLSATNATSAKTSDGKINGTSTDMEYKLSTSSSYTRASSGSTAVKSGTYLVRYAATGSEFAGKTVSIKVGADATTTTTTTDKSTLTSTANKTGSTTTAGRGNTATQTNTATTGTSNRKTAGGGESEDFDIESIDGDDIWSNLTSSAKDTLLDLMKDGGAEILDGSYFIGGAAGRHDSVNIKNKPVVFIIGKGAVVIQKNSSDARTIIRNAYAVANAILSNEQLNMVAQGSILKVDISTTSLEEESLTEDEKASIDESIEKYSTDHPDLLKAGIIDISIKYQLDDTGWQQVTDLYNPIEFVFPLPDEVNGSIENIFMLREHDGESVLLSDIDDDPHTITINSGQFSTYIFMHEPKVSISYLLDDAEKEGHTESGTNIWMILFCSVMGMEAGCGLLYILIKKRIIHIKQ